MSIQESRGFFGCDMDTLARFRRFAGDNVSKCLKIRVGLKKAALQSS